MTKRYRRTVFSVTVLLMAMSLFMLTQDNVNTVFQTNQVEPSNVYTFTFVSQEGENATDSDEVYYTDSFFQEGNGEYDHQLGRASLALAMTSFEKSYVETFLESLGYGEMTFYRYNKKSDEDKVALALASKEVDGQDIIVMCLRGGKYGDEWGSNGRVGYEDEAFGYHYGFHKAAEDALEQLKKYTAEKEIDLGSTKLWIAGFSRAAAVSNVLGQKLQESGLINAGNLYCYTFGTPSTVSASLEPAQYSGIYNVVNPLDIVTRLPMYAGGVSETPSGNLVEYRWDYIKYGETLELPTRSETSQLQVVQMLENALAFATRNEANYVKKNQEQVIIPAFKKTMGKGADVSRRNAAAVLVGALPGVTVFLQNELNQLDFKAQFYVGSLLSGNKSLRMEKEHWPETYWGWMVKVEDLA